MLKRISSYTLGCKLNFSETSAFSDSLANDGFKVVPFGTPSDVTVINTCSVTDNANKKCRNIIRRALRYSPNSFIVVTGCYAQLEPQEIASIEGVDLILGAKEKFSFRNTITTLPLTKRESPLTLVSNISNVETFAYGHSFVTLPNRERTRAYLKIQDGCDYTCSYCTIPLARGKSRSLSIAKVIEQANMLIRGGYNEIVLTGVNTGDFGSKERQESFYDLLNEMAALPIRRIRISSIEPNLLTSNIIDLIASSSNIVPHFHIPLQSGSNTTLKRMQRRYSTSLYRDRITEVISKLNDCCIGADVIVGYLGETENDFEESFQFIQNLPLAYLHVFTFSLRANTKAESQQASFEMPPHAVITARRLRLEGLSLSKRAKFNTAFIGATKEVLFEDEHSCDIELTLNASDNLYCFGYTDNYLRVGVKIPSKEFSAEFLQGNFERSGRHKLELVKINDFFSFGAFAEDGKTRNELPLVAVKRATLLFNSDFIGKDVIIIGDTPYDIECARVLNSKSIAVATGNKTIEELKKFSPDVAVKNFHDTNLILEAILS
ncbi:hypothetical protein CHS0354_024054 [Potamilus streckersoni]|uniref:tRNA (N(6)-L-threonylcarbamoyladenosine(37)-C(2))-methylthiotransferase MtaB n=1 Tax=Potamilus streckersoni TaxID=2493646 RepID=A0AAE0RZJ9_9BIVA|nr:hypothetical protein CHS0354_024054 [Potamilus streckersoni]